MSKRTDGLDQIDRKILNVVQRNCRMTFAEIADYAGTSAPSCMRRVKQLKENGIIEREVALVNPKQLGRGLTAISEVRLNYHSAQARDQVIDKICAIPEVIVCYNTSGSRDLLFITLVNDMEDFEATISEPLSGVPEIMAINSYFAIKRLKFEPMVFFDESR